MKLVSADGRSPGSAIRKAMLLPLTVPLRLALLIAIIIWARRA
jgi:hypothetical protein